MYLAGNFPHNNEPHYVYRYYDASDRLLYVGCTYNPPARRRQHAHKSSWFPDAVRVRHVVYPTRYYGLEKEREAIIAERPLHNKAWINALDDEQTAINRAHQLERERSGISARERKADALRSLRGGAA